MKSGIHSALALFMASVFMVLAPSWVGAEVTFNQIVVFGGSVSDPGNAYVLIKQQNTPPYDDPKLLDQKDLVPCAPYAVGAHHFSNGATWVEQLAKPLGLYDDAGPAFQDTGRAATNYAIGGTRARNDATTLSCDRSTFNATPSLEQQVGKFLSDHDFYASPGALYVLDIGGNDVRDALVALLTGGDPGGIITNAVTAIGSNIQSLYIAGARKFLVLDVPNIGLTPAVSGLGGSIPVFADGLTQAFNSGLNFSLELLKEQRGDIQIVRLSLYDVITDVVKNEKLGNVKDSCIQPATPTDTAVQCPAPDTYLFWDGVHPTKAGHQIIKEEAERVLAQPLQDARQPWWVSNATAP